MLQWTRTVSTKRCTTRGCAVRWSLTAWGRPEPSQHACVGCPVRLGDGGRPSGVPVGPAPSTGLGPITTCCCTRPRPPPSWTASPPTTTAAHGRPNWTSECDRDVPWRGLVYHPTDFGYRILDHFPYVWVDLCSRRPHHLERRAAAGRHRNRGPGRRALGSAQGYEASGSGSLVDRPAPGDLAPCRSPAHHRYHGGRSTLYRHRTPAPSG